MDSDWIQTQALRATANAEYIGRVIDLHHPPSRCNIYPTSCWTRSAVFGQYWTRLKHTLTVDQRISGMTNASNTLTGRLRAYTGVTMTVQRRFYLAKIAFEIHRQCSTIEDTPLTIRDACQLESNSILACVRHAMNVCRQRASKQERWSCWNTKNTA